ncbi:MAG: aminopeptidase [Sphingomonadales bacterium RIFCSPHIGHO2_01_FULL_65_20]|uniref:M1 family metallopeptidase n=1 Tax=unclassified Blastomonas TaxID=2626550 RepID=UPI0008377F5C|nr:M1 family metallopeptidase [Blastomonas sp.]OHC92394.1 MAG: aminopeptidase [Sphingomonadales bacterium RIFCSPHIGHO2_01_FULL_65_20]
MRRFSAVSASLLALAIGAASTAAIASPVEQTKGSYEDKFRQLEGEEWPTPTDYRNASGAPGYRYWQQKVDYDVQARLDEAKRTVSGSQTVRYVNNSPDALPYLWLLLDQNQYKRDSIEAMTETVSGDKISLAEVRRLKRLKEWEGGFTITAVRDASGKALPFTVVDSLLRIDLSQAVAPNGGETSFSIEWSFPMAENKVVGGRSGYECFTQPGEDGNCIFEGAQWFPRLAVYSDYEGWHNKAFLGSGEFTLEFGDYRVALTVPADHVVAATGVLQNPDQALSAAQRQRLEQAKSATSPVYVVTPQEAVAAERGKASGEKTWVFSATNVRDFGWASSRKFAWDAMGVKQDYADQPLVMAMSFFPKEARPLWDAYSTKAIAHTIDVYGKFAFPYPYPVAQSVNGPVGGMEYPMITFNGPRPVKDKKTGNLTYTERAKYGLIGVVIHEIGHNWFPMIVNSDERQWTWMDEGLNTFLQFQAERLWDKDYPARRGEPKDIAEYMLSTNQMPLMTQSDSVLQFGANGYGKPATALTILRETVLGRELFDRAFREYANRWRFKHPTPYDFFRTMEESSGVDLDWFWRGWFYSTDHVDIALDKVVRATLEPADATAAAAERKKRRDAEPGSLTAARNAGQQTVVERDPSTRDFYDSIDPLDATAADKRKAAEAFADLTAEERAARQVTDNFYRFSFSNRGGLVMPVILKMDFSDGTSETARIPAEVWRYNQKAVTWQFVTPKTLTRAEIDPLWETADADRSNNVYTGQIDPKTLGIETPEETKNRMKDSDVKVQPDSLRTFGAPK